MNARLIDAGTARILGAAAAEAPRDWKSASVPAGWGRWSVPPPPDLGEGAPVPWAPAREGGCEDWEESVDRLQTRTLELKARYWAARAASPGFDTSRLRRNPGAEIRSMELRYRFYGRLKELYYGGVQPLSPSEMGQLKLSDEVVEGLQERCLR
ncbi:MAG TPA: hypothetical protein DCM05_02560 [Elusimicrobia bacterium]|nr:hypothetical protein [Elusimicrobiota bacterium]